MLSFVFSVVLSLQAQKPFCVAKAQCSGPYLEVSVSYYCKGSGRNWTRIGFIDSAGFVTATDASYRCGETLARRFRVTPGGILAGATADTPVTFEDYSCQAQPVNCLR